MVYLSCIVGVKVMTAFPTPSVARLQPSVHGDRTIHSSAPFRSGCHVRDLGIVVKFCILLFCCRMFFSARLNCHVFHVLMIAPARGATSCPITITNSVPDAYTVVGRGDRSYLIDADRIVWFPVPQRRSCGLRWRLWESFVE